MLQCKEVNQDSTLIIIRKLSFIKVLRLVFRKGLVAAYTNHGVSRDPKIRDKTILSVICLLHLSGNVCSKTHPVWRPTGFSTVSIQVMSSCWVTDLPTEDPVKLPDSCHC